MRLTDSLLGLILFYATVHLPFGIFVMRNAFESRPEPSSRIPATSTAPAPCGRCSRCSGRW